MLQVVALGDWGKDRGLQCRMYLREVTSQQAGRVLLQYLLRVATGNATGSKGSTSY